MSSGYSVFLIMDLSTFIVMWDGNDRTEDCLGCIIVFLFLKSFFLWRTVSLTESSWFSRFKVLQQRQPSPADAASKSKYMDVARRLEEGLYKMAISKVVSSLLFGLLGNSNKIG